MNVARHRTDGGAHAYGCYLTVNSDHLSFHGARLRAGDRLFPRRAYRFLAGRDWVDSLPQGRVRAGLQRWPVVPGSARFRQMVRIADVRCPAT